MTIEEETLELYRKSLEEDQQWRRDTLRLVALEVGAKMHDAQSSISTTHRNNVFSTAKWAYTQATGKTW